MLVIPPGRRAPLWIVRSPLFHSWWLETANRLHCQREVGRSARLLQAAIMGAICLAVALAIKSWPLWLQAVGTHLPTVSLLTTFQACVLVHQGRRKWTAAYAISWLSTVPMTRRALIHMIALRSILGPLLFLALLTIVTLPAQAIAGGSRNLALTLLACCGTATAVGALLGWWLPQSTAERSGSALMRARAVGLSASAALAGLSHWPIAQTRAWLQPRTISRLLLPALLLLPIGVSGIAAIALMLLWLLVIYLLVLLRATVLVAREGARWLRPTPLSFGRFAWAVVRHPVLKQLQWTLVLMALLVALGSKPIVALRVAQWWLAVVSATSSIAVAHAYHSRTMGLKIAVSVCTLTALESVKEYLALPCALLFSAWQFKRGART